jgi:hypothetical protein
MVGKSRKAGTAGRRGTDKVETKNVTGISGKTGTTGRTGKDKVETKNVRGGSKRCVNLPSSFIDCSYNRISFHLQNAHFAV